MKKLVYGIFFSSISCGLVSALETITYSNYIRQYQIPSGVVWDASATVNSNGTQFSDLTINKDGARLDLHTIKSSSLSGLTSYLLDTSYVGAYVPVAKIEIRSEDMSGAIPRTRADRPFYVDITINGLRSGLDDPEASKSVNFIHHIQSYGVEGSELGIDRTQATILGDPESLSKNEMTPRSYGSTSIPGDDPSKIRGEERFSVFSLKDERPGYSAPESQLASKYIQIFPISDGSISGISPHDVIKFNLPPLTFIYNDLYPTSTTYAQVYQGEPKLGTVGTIIPGSSVIVNDSTSQNRVLSTTDYESVFTNDGRWTIEIITITPFGVERVQTPSGSPATFSFDLDRTINVNGTVTTIE